MAKNFTLQRLRAAGRHAERYTQLEAQRPATLPARDGLSVLGLVDLTTAALHEIGHVLNVPHAPAKLFPHDVMNEIIGLSTRRILDGVEVARSGDRPQRAAEHRPQRESGVSDEFETGYIIALLAARETEQRAIRNRSALDTLLADEDFLDELFNDARTGIRDLIQVVG